MHFSCAKMKLYCNLFAIYSVILFKEARGGTEVDSAFVSSSPRIFTDSFHKQSNVFFKKALHLPNLRVQHRFPSLIKASGDDSQSSAPQEEKKLTPETVVEMIEVTFINACLQLAKGYV